MGAQGRADTQVRPYKTITPKGNPPGPSCQGSNASDEKHIGSQNLPLRSVLTPDKGAWGVVGSGIA